MTIGIRRKAMVTLRVDPAARLTAATGTALANNQGAVPKALLPNLPRGRAIEVKMMTTRPNDQNGEIATKGMG